MKDQIPVLFIDDKKIEFKKLREVFDRQKYFRLINDTPICDEESSRIYSRDEQKKKIIKLIEEKKDEYKIILFDLSMRNETDRTILAEALDNLLCVEIYEEKKEWFKQEGKLFVFVSGYEFPANNRNIRDPFDVLQGRFPQAKCLKKSTDPEEYYGGCVRYDDEMNSLCGGTFKNCRRDECFNNILKKFAQESGII